MKPIKRKLKSEDIYSIIPISLIVSVVPLIIYMKVQDPQDDLLKYYWSASPLIDISTYYKSFALILITVLAMIIFIKKLNENSIKIKKSNLYIFMVLYVVLTVLSSLLSKNTSISLYGIVGRYEGMFVLLSYIIVMFLTINMVNSEKQIKYIFNALFLSSSIISIIGLFQYFGHDIFNSPIIRKIIIPKSYQGQGINFPFNAGDVYTTLAHNNYVGSYTAMLLPLFTVLFLTIKDRQSKIIKGLLSALMLILLIISHSRAGLIGVIFSAIIIMVMMRKIIIKNWKYAIAFFLILIAIFIGLDRTGGGILTYKIKQLYSDVSTVVKNDDSINLKDIRINKNEIDVLLDNSSLKIAIEGTKLVFLDENDKKINITNDSNNKITLQDDRYKNLSFIPLAKNNVKILQMMVKGNSIYFGLLQDGFKFMTHKSDFVDLKPVAKWGFEDKESLGSYRGYIWSRTIPLLKDAIVLGYGPDTFPIYFPQYDYVGKFANYGIFNMFVDKPHNMFLDVAISTGFISLIALLGLFVSYFVVSFRLYYNNDYNNKLSNYGLAIFTAFCGYIVSGLFNDSVVTVAPIFWVLMGIGISINMSIKNESGKGVSINQIL